VPVVLVTVFQVTVVLEPVHSCIKADPAFGLECNNNA